MITPDQSMHYFFLYLLDVDAIMFVAGVIIICSKSGDLEDDSDDVILGEGLILAALAMYALIFIGFGWISVAYILR